jgi:hypothetical protein
VLAGQGEELARPSGCPPRADLAQGLEQPLDDGAEQFIDVQIQGRPRQPRVAVVQQRGAELVQAADGSVQQAADERFGRRAGQRVQVALDDDGGLFLAHNNSPRPAQQSGGIVPPPAVTPPRPGNC